VSYVLSGSSKQAHALFRQFHCFPAEKVVHHQQRRVIPPVLVHLGDLKGLIYRSDRSRRGCLKTYIHFMETPPLLACDPEGRQLYILGGNYRVTGRGIEG
jgi:hypothetical protein